MERVWFKVHISVIVHFHTSCLSVIVVIGRHSVSLVTCAFQPGVKLVCAALSLPIVTDSAKYAAQEVNKVSDKVVGNDGDLEQKTPYKILLLGYDQSETSTIYKQVCPFKVVISLQLYARLLSVCYNKRKISNR